MPSFRCEPLPGKNGHIIGDHDMRRHVVPNQYVMPIWPSVMQFFAGCHIDATSDNNVAEPIGQWPKFRFRLTAPEKAWKKRNADECCSGQTFTHNKFASRQPHCAVTVRQIKTNLNLAKRGEGCAIIVN